MAKQRRSATCTAASGDDCDAASQSSISSESKARLGRRTKRKKIPSAEVRAFLNGYGGSQCISFEEWERTGLRPPPIRANPTIGYKLPPTNSRHHKTKKIGNDTLVKMMYGTFMGSAPKNGLLVLDDLGDQKMRIPQTTSTLIQAHLSPRQIYVPNNGERAEEVVEKCRRLGAHAVPKSMELALLEDWPSLRLSGCYIDSTTNNVERLISLLTLAVKRAAPRDAFIIGATLVLRGVGSSQLIEALRRVHTFVKRHRLNYWNMSPSSTQFADGIEHYKSSGGMGIFRWFLYRRESLTR